MSKKFAALLIVFLIISFPVSFALQIKEDTVEVSEITDDSAKFEWETDDSSNGYVRYGVNSDDLSEVPETGGETKEHSVVVDGLSSAEKYYYRLKAEAGEEVELSSHFDFSTLPSPPDGLEAEDVTHNSSTVSWDSVSGADKYIVYVDDEKYEETSDTSVGLDELTPETAYSVYVVAVDSDERESKDSDVLEFETEEEPVEIKFVEVTGITNTSATISWETSKEVKGEVKYDKDIYLDYSEKEDSATKKHSITLTDLEPDTTYYYQIISGEEETEEEESFKTRESRPLSEILDIENVSVESVSSDSATIVWETSVPSDGEIRYGPDEDLESVEEVDTEEMQHNVTLKDLLSSTKYYFKINANDVESSFKEFETEGSTRDFLSLDSLPELTNKGEINVSGETAPDARVYIFVNEESTAQVRENVDGTKFKFPVKLSSMANFKDDEGKNKITVMSWDANGNKDVAETYVTYDSAPPKLEIRDLPTLTNKREVTVNGVSEEGANIVFYTNDRKESEINELEETGFNKTISLGSDNTTLRIDASDKAGNKESFEEEIIFDNEEPSIEFNNTWKETHFKLFRIWGTTEPGAEINAVNLGKYESCQTAAHEFDYVNCREFLDGEKISGQVDPVAAAVGVERDTTADEDGEFSLTVPLVTSYEDGDGTETRNNILINATDKAGNSYDTVKSLTYKPGCSDWRVGTVESHPFNIYTNDLSAGDITGSAFFPVYYRGSGTPEVIEVGIGEDDSDSTGKPVNPDSSEDVGNNEISLKMENTNEHISLRDEPKATAYSPSENAFNVYAPIKINKYTGSIEDYPDELYAYLGVHIRYEGPDGETSCEVYPKASFDVQKPEDVVDWLTPEQINNTIEGLSTAINHTEKAVDIAEQASMYGTVACGVMVVWQYVKGFASGGDDNSEGECSEQEQAMKKVYYVCDRVLCPSVPPRCNEFESLGDYKVDGKSAEEEEFQEQLNENMKCREKYKDYAENDKAPVSFEKWRSDEGEEEENCDYKEVTPPSFKTEAPSPTDPDRTQDLFVDYYEVRNGKVVEDVSESVDVGKGELNTMAKNQCGRGGSGTLIVQGSATSTGEAGILEGETKEYSQPQAECKQGVSPEEVMSGGESYQEDEEDEEKGEGENGIPKDYGRPDKDKIRGCYDESCPDFDGTKCPKLFSLGSASGGGGGNADINPPEGLWSSLKCVCLPGILKHLQNYLKVMKGAKKCLQQAQIGEVKGGFCKRLMAQFVCDLLIEAFKFILSMEPSGSSANQGSDRGMISDYKENSEKVSESLSDRYSGVVRERLGLSTDQLVHKSCMFAVTQDWDMMDGLFEDFIDSTDVPPVATIMGESRPYGYDPFTGKMSIGYNIYVGVVPGGETELKLVLKCDEDEPGGKYCGDGAEPVDITSKLGSSHLRADDAPINRNLVWEESAVYWYNVVELQLDYYVGDERKSEVVKKQIFRKGDLAAQCSFSTAEGIYCDSYEGLAGEDGVLELMDFDSGSRISPKPTRSFVPGDNIAALVESRNQFDGDNAYVWFETEDETFEYEIVGTGQRTAEGREGIRYYNLFIDQISEKESDVSIDGNRNILEEEKAIETDDGELNLKVEEAKRITLQCSGEDNDGNEVSGESKEFPESGKEDEDLTANNKIKLKCIDDDDGDDEPYKIDELEVRGVEPKNDAVGNEGITIYVKDDDDDDYKHEFNVDLDTEEGRSDSKDVKMNVLQDTSDNGQGDTVILYDGKNQETETSYQIQTKQTGDKPAIDFIQPVGESVSPDSGIPIGFNLWNDNQELKELKITIEGRGQENRDYGCSFKLDEDDVEDDVIPFKKLQDSFDKDECTKVFKIKEGRHTFFGKSDEKLPPFFEFILEWDDPKDKYRDQDANYKVTIEAEGEDGKSDKKHKEFKVYPEADENLKEENMMITLGGECDELEKCLPIQDADTDINTSGGEDAPDTKVTG